MIKQAAIALRRPVFGGLATCIVLACEKTGNRICLRYRVVSLTWNVHSRQPPHKSGNSRIGIASINFCRNVDAGCSPGNPSVFEVIAFCYCVNVLDHLATGIGLAAIGASRIVYAVPRQIALTLNPLVCLPFHDDVRKRRWRGQTIVFRGCVLFRPIHQIDFNNATADAAIDLCIRVQWFRNSYVIRIDRHRTIVAVRCGS